jgi:PPP family 3-phenylpropionic acid transporter
MVRISLFIYFLFSTFSVMVFFLPLYLQNQGLDSSQVGTIIACGALVSMFAQPFWGFMSDKRKTVKHVLIVLMFSSFLISLGLFSMESFILIMLFYIAFMFFNSAIAPLTETLCISYAHDHNKDYGRVRVWGEIGVGTSALMLGIVVERIGLDYLWVIYLIILSIAISTCYFIRDTSATTVPVNIKALGKLFRQPKLLWFLFLVLVVAIPHRMNDSMLALYLDELGGSESQLGTAWLVATLSTVPALMFVGKVIRRWNELGIFIIAAFMYALRWIIYSQADSPNILIASQAFHSLTFPLFLVASIQYLTTIVPRELRATGQAAFAVVFGGIGGIIGSAGGGFVINEFGPHTAYGIGSIFALIGAVSAVGTYMYNRRKNNIPIVENPSK